MTIGTLECAAAPDYAATGEPLGGAAVGAPVRRCCTCHGFHITRKIKGTLVVLVRYRRYRQAAA